MPDPAELLTRLHRAPLPDFIATRKALAAELRAAGQRAEAQAFLKHPKPRPAAWVANQLSHDAPELVEAARASTAALSEAQVTGGRTVEEMQGLSEARKTALQRLVDAGEARARDAGLSLTRVHLDELRDTFAAWSARPDAHPLGQLTRALPAPSFDLLDAASFAPTQPKHVPTSSPAGPPRPVTTAGAAPAAGAHARTAPATPPAPTTRPHAPTAPRSSGRADAAPSANPSHPRAPPRRHPPRRRRPKRRQPDAPLRRPSAQPLPNAHAASSRPRPHASNAPARRPGAGKSGSSRPEQG